MFLIRLIRVAPLILILIVVAVVAFMIARRTAAPVKAKDIVLKVFTWLTIGITVFFLLVSLYALLEKNTNVFELMLGFAIVGAIGLIITRICHAVFIKHNPKYKHKKNVEAQVSPRGLFK